MRYALIRTINPARGALNFDPYSKVLRHCSAGILAGNRFGEQALMPALPLRRSRTEKTKTWLARLIILSLLWVFALHAANAATPDIALPDLDGKPRNVNEFIGHGQWVVVVFWSHDCRICAREIHHMEAFHKAHHTKDAIVLGVSLDGASLVERARQFSAEHHLSFINLLAEPDAAVVPRFGAGKFVGTPTHLFFDPSGRLVGRKIGPISGADIEEFIEAFNSSPYAVVPPVKQ